MSNLKFSMTPVEEKAQRSYRKGSKYDPIIDDFVKSEHTLVTIATEKEPNYLRTQLNKRIQARKLEGVSVSVVNNVLYLEKTE